MSADGYGSLGFYNLALISISCGFGCLVSATILKKIGAKACLIIGALSNALWVFGSLIVAMKYENPESSSIIYTKEFVYPILILTSTLSGFTDAIMWIA